jgi:hypothetical protein
MLRRVVWQKFAEVSEVLIALMMEAANTSETSVNVYQTTRRNIPEDCHLREYFIYLYFTFLKNRKTVTEHRT